MIDFFSCVTETLNDEEFYIRDDEIQEPVYVVRSFGGQRVSDATGLPIRCAKVNNDMRNDVDLIPVDNNPNIRLLRDDGSDDYRCDGMLCTERRITFFEIKDVKKNVSEQLKHAKEQIASTIIHFDKNHSMERRKRQAYVCNVYKEDFRMSSIMEPSNKEEKEMFFSSYRARLFYGAAIVV